MAERYPQIEAPLVMDPTEARINQTFDRLVMCLNNRRVQLITDFRQRQEDRRAAETNRMNTLKQLTNSKANLQAEMKENMLHSMRENMIKEMEAKMRQLEVAVKETEVLFDCNTQKLEEAISGLGQLVERDISIPNYPALLQPSISVEEIRYARRIAFDETSQLIYLTAITDYMSYSISVFSITGEYIDTFCKGQVKFPSGIALSGEDVYITDVGLHCIFRFKLPKFKFLTKLGKIGSGIGEFNYPNSITIALNKDVFVTDRDNNRIVVMTAKLEHKHYITHDTMTGLRDVKLLDDKVYVLSFKDNPCLHVFNLTGEKLRSFISCSLEGNEQVIGCCSFCFDKKQNIIMGDCTAGRIKVFSQEGTLLHTLGEPQEEDKRISPMGIVVTNDNKIICSSFYTKFGLHIFC